MMSVTVTCQEGLRLMWSDEQQRLSCESELIYELNDRPLSALH